MLRIQAIRRFGLLLLVGAVALPAAAGEGRIPIWEPTSINQSGSYVVTRNIAAGGTAIEILASGVELDLNGMVVGGGAAASPTIHVIGASDVRIHNGTVANGSDGVLIEGGGKSFVIEDLQIQGGGVAGHGIAVIEGTDVAIRRNMIRDKQGTGIFFDPQGVFPAATGILENNQIERVQDGIFVESGSSLIVRHNRIEDTFASFGIRIQNSFGVLLSENTLQNIAAEGIVVEASFACKLYNNVVLLAQGPGIGLFATMDSLLIDNVVSQSGGDGMVIDGERNHIERNVLNRNGLSGAGYGLLLFGNSNVYRKNTARGNPGGACAGFPATSDLCDDTAASTTFGDNYMPGLI